MNTRSLAVAALAVAMPSHGWAYGGAPTSSFCLAVNDARASQVISIEVDGYTGYWTMGPNETKVLIASQTDDPQQALRAASFTLRIYDGNQGSRGELLATTTIAGDGNVYSPHTISTPVGPAGSDERTAPECKATGEWIVLVHD